MSFLIIILVDSLFLLFVSILDKKNISRKKNIIFTSITSVLAIILTLGFMGAEINATSNTNEKSKVENKLEEEQSQLIEENSYEPIISEDEYKNECTEYKFKDVLRNPENYIGKKVKVRIEISSVHEKSLLNETKYYLGYTESQYGWYGDEYAIIDDRYDESLKLLSDDVIDVYGEIADPEYTSSFILNSKEVFVINMKYVDLIEE